MGAAMFRILYEDADLIVCVKPAGTATQTRRAGQQDMVSLLRNYRHQKGEEPYIGLVHRLDQPVEGILVFGKHTKSTAALARQLTKGMFSKVYLAVTEGNMPQQEGKRTDYIKKDAHDNRSEIVPASDAKAKKAELYYRVLETDQKQDPVKNLVKIQLLTGRHHQIRVQMAHFGTPLAGDRKYGRPQGDQALGLCACELAFRHPATGKEMAFAITPSQAVFKIFHTY